MNKMIHKMYYKRKDEMMMGCFIEKSVNVAFYVQPKAEHKRDTEKLVIMLEGAKRLDFFPKSRSLLRNS